MAMIKCPECGREVSSLAKTCPNCGFSIADATNDVIRIFIQQHPTVLGMHVKIKEYETGKLLAEIPSGTVAEIKTAKAIKIGFYGMTRIAMCVATVSPQNGGKYKATWGTGFFAPSINACVKVDIIDA